MVGRTESELVACLGYCTLQYNLQRGNQNSAICAYVLNVHLA